MWTLILHFGRGHSQTIEFEDKLKALEALRIGVFINEDCINCSLFKTNKSNNNMQA
jgi:hypothetical protein